MFRKHSLLLIFIILIGTTSISCGNRYYSDLDTMVDLVEGNGNENSGGNGGGDGNVNISGTVKDYQHSFDPVDDARVHLMEVAVDGTLTQINPPSFTAADGIFNLEVTKYSFYALWAKSPSWQGGTPQHCHYYRQFTSDTLPTDITLEVGSAKPPWANRRTTSGGYLKILRDSIMLESDIITIEGIDGGNDLLTATTAGEKYLIVGTVTGKSADEQGLRYIDIPEGSYKVSFNGIDFTIFVEDVGVKWPPPLKSTFLYFP